MTLLVAGIILICPAIAPAATLAWDPPNGNVVGYRLYFGVESLNYPFVIDVGPVTSCSLPPNLLFGTTYYLAIKAYNDVGVESEFSSEIVYTPQLRITSIFTDDYGTVLTWESEPGAFYRVLATQSLTDPSWADVSGPLFSPSNTRVWPHIKTFGEGAMFYRVEAVSGR